MSNDKDTVNGKRLTVRQDGGFTEVKAIPNGVENVKESSGPGIIPEAGDVMQVEIGGRSQSGVIRPAEHKVEPRSPYAGKVLSTLQTASGRTVTDPSKVDTEHCTVRVGSQRMTVDTAIRLGFVTRTPDGQLWDMTEAE